jgi:drug/metabolite transporter (DMT)-like permease
MTMKKLDTRELLAFFAIYIVWGSTYLAIREAVATIPPLLTAGVRHFTAALVLYAIVAWMRGPRVRVTAVEWRSSVVVAVLFFLIGHGTLHWAERTVPSGIAALFVATEPVWIAMLMPAGVGSGMRLRTAGGLLLGLVGVGLLVPLESFAAASREFWGSLAILVGAMSWALGIRYAATASLPRDPFVRAATTLLCGAALLLTASVLTGEVARVDVHAISVRSLVGLGYLIVFGSVVAFAAYTWLLERRSATIVATHTFVNPVVAVLLGWLVAGEALTPRIAGSMGFILAALLLLRSAHEDLPSSTSSLDSFPLRRRGRAQSSSVIRVESRHLRRSEPMNGKCSA